MASADLSDRKFAVIIDEAHSSQSGSAADKMNEAISGGGDEEEPEDLQDKILAAMEARKMGTERLVLCLHRHAEEHHAGTVRPTEQRWQVRAVPPVFDEAGD